MDFENFFPMWDKLTKQQKDKISQSALSRKVDKGTIIHNSSADCLGLMLILSGQLRAYILSDEGREITLYRLFELDICLFTASCMMRNIQFEIFIEAEKDTDVWIIPPNVFKEIMEESVAISNYINDIMSSRFSEVMWLMEQIMWKSFDKRLASFLVEESILDGTTTLKITHEKIANHLGTAREVVTRMLKYFQNEGIVKLTRGMVEITDMKKLEYIQNKR